MSDSIDGLRRTAELAETASRVLEGQLDRLDRDRRTSYARVPGVEVDPARYPHDEEGLARFRHDLATARRDWLLGRYEELSAREQRAAEAAERRRAGVSRFLAGKFTLDDMTRPEMERQLDVWRAAGSGPVSVRAAEEHEKVMQEIRGEPTP